MPTSEKRLRDTLLDINHTARALAVAAGRVVSWDQVRVELDAIADVAAAALIKGGDDADTD